MGIWDFINSGKETVKWHTPELVKKARNTSYNYSAAAITKIDNVVRELGQSMPDDQDRAKIVSFSTKFAKNASVYAVKEASKYIIPGGRAVAKIYSETVREVETEQKKQDKSCIKESVGDSNKNTTSDGGSKIAKEGLKDQSPSRPRLDKQDLTVMMEEMQAKMEKLQDDIYSTKQQNEVSAKCANGLDSFEFSDEPIKGSTPTKSNKKKVFIRSRL